MKFLSNWQKQLWKFFDQYRHNQYRIFLTLLYLWIIGNTLLLSFGHDHFWGDFDRFIPRKDLNDMTLITQSLNLLFVPAVEKYYPLFIALQIVFAIFAIFHKQPRLSAFVVWFLTVNLDNKIYVTTDGGNNLIQILLFYSIFLIDSQSIKSTIFSRYVGVISFFMCRFQICLVYFMAGLSKVTGEFWTTGMGIYYSLSVDEYSHPLLLDLVKSYPPITVFGTYLTLFFQLSFPFLIWIRQLRPIYFIIGSFIHLGISLGMGLLSFGLAMMVAYAAFYTEDQAKRIATSIMGLGEYVRLFSFHAESTHVMTGAKK